MNTQKGFTLIELMIVIAIIAILAAIALPAYNNYVAKSQVTEAVSLASSFKAPVSVSVAEDGVCPMINKAGTGTGEGSEGNLGQYVQSLGVTGSDGNCIITATMGTNGVSKKAQGGVIKLTATAPKVVAGSDTDTDITKWTCTAVGLPESLLPKSCKVVAA